MYKITRSAARSAATSAAYGANGRGGAAVAPDPDDYPGNINFDNPEGYWRLGSPSGTIAVDETGANDGTFVGSPTLGVAGLLVGDADTAVTFTTGQLVDIGDVHDRTPIQPLTVEFLFKTTASAVTQDFVVKRSLSGVFEGWGIHALPTKEIYFEFQSTVGANRLRVDMVAFFNDGQPHHCVIKYDGSTNASGVTMIVDDVVQATTIIYDNLSAGDITTGTFPFCIAGVDGTTGRYIGTLDEVSIYSALSAARSTAHFAATGL